MLVLRYWVQKLARLVRRRADDKPVVWLGLTAEADVILRMTGPGLSAGKLVLTPAEAEEFIAGLRSVIREALRRKSKAGA